MFDVIVVGGGPGGLLAGYYFQQNDLNYLILERDTVGSSFRKMKPDMILLSPAIPSADWTSLTLKQPIWALNGVRKPYPTRDDFVCYLEKFAIDNSLHMKEHSHVSLIQKEDSGFRVVTGDNEYLSKYVLIATGYYARPMYPHFPGVRDNPFVIHYADFFSCMAYQGKRVLVVGGGNSAAELAIELSGVSDVTLKTRGHLRFFSETDDLGDIRGLSESVLKELIRFHIIHHLWEEDIKEIDGANVVFESEKRERFDKIILATGFLPEIPTFAGAEVELSDNKTPLITDSGESISAPGVFFSGSLAMFHTRCRFIHGFRNEAERVTWAIFDRL